MDSLTTMRQKSQSFIEIIQLKPKFIAVSLINAQDKFIKWIIRKLDPTVSAVKNNEIDSLDDELNRKLSKN